MAIWVEVKWCLDKMGNEDGLLGNDVWVGGWGWAGGLRSHVPFATGRVSGRYTCELFFLVVNVVFFD